MTQDATKHGTSVRSDTGQPRVRATGTRRLRAMAAAAGIVLLAGCSAQGDIPEPVEVLAEAPVLITVHASGDLRAIRATALNVPGDRWSSRQLTWMLPEGTHVKAGDLVARFTADQGELELEKALLDMQRNALARAAKETELDTTQGRVGVDLAQVGTELAIAQRYAGADLDMFARNEILDAIQNERFLGVKQDVLEWRQGQASERGGAELGVLEAQRATFALTADTKRSDLAALELRAPHDGVLMLEQNWSGEKPRVGTSMWAGNEFGKLPDTAALEVRLSLPQLEAQGIAVGDVVEIHPSGQPAQAVTTQLSWVAGAAQVKDRNSPVKFVSVKAPVPAEAVERFRWVPGMGFEARIVIASAERGLTVPNVAVIASRGETWVEVRSGNGFERRRIELGERGIARSQVVSGLAPGDAVRLTPEGGA